MFAHGVTTAAVEAHSSKNSAYNYRILPGKRPCSRKRPPPLFGIPSDLGGYPRKRPPLPFRP